MNVNLVLCTAFALLSSFANASLEANMPAEMSDVKVAPVGPVTGIYKFEKAVRILPSSIYLNDKLEDNNTAVEISFAKDEPVAINLEDSGKIVLTPILGPDEQGRVPEKLILAPPDFASAGLIFVNSGNEDRLKKEFSDFAETQVASLDKSAPRARRHRGIGNCVAYVLNHIGVHVPGNGKDIAGALTHVGFSRVSCSNPAVGTVASWSGGWHGLGHTGLWNGRCYAYDRGCQDPGKNYHLLGCVRRI